MKLKFHQVELSGIGAESTTDDAMAGHLHLALLDEEKQRFSHLHIEMNLPKNAEITFGQLQESARTQSITILRKALNVLEKHDIPELEQMGRDRAAEQLSQMMPED